MHKFITISSENSESEQILHLDPYQTNMTSEFTSKEAE